jgi:hypothetical protein
MCGRREQPWSTNIHRKNKIPIIRGKIGKRGRPCDAGVADHGIKASKGSRRIVHEPGRNRRIGEISQQRKRLDADPTKFFDQSFEFPGM